MNNSKSNGKVEAAVQSAKKLLHKTAKGGDEFHFRLIAERNTPSQGIGSSPAQRLITGGQEHCCPPPIPSWNQDPEVKVKRERERS